MQYSPNIYPTKGNTGLYCICNQSRRWPSNYWRTMAKYVWGAGTSLRSLTLFFSTTSCYSYLQKFCPVSPMSKFTNTRDNRKKLNMTSSNITCLHRICRPMRIKDHRLLPKCHKHIHFFKVTRSKNRLHNSSQMLSGTVKYGLTLKFLRYKPVNK